jgi:hypothetical protein
MNQPPRSGKKILYILDNQHSRPPLLQKEGKLFYAVSHSSPKLRLTAMPFRGFGGKISLFQPFQCNFNSFNCLYQKVI